MSKVRCIGISTGGGDAPGLNAVIRAAVKCAILKYKWKVIGIPDGFDGLIWPEKSRELTLEHVSSILPRGGTILGTTNRGNPFEYRVTENGKEVTRDIADEVIANSRKLGIDAIIAIGGDGSQKIAWELFRAASNWSAFPRRLTTIFPPPKSLSALIPRWPPPPTPWTKFTPRRKLTTA